VTDTLEDEMMTRGWAALLLLACAGAKDPADTGTPEETDTDTDSDTDTEPEGDLSLPCLLVR
jgi:hypothetical protein